MKTYILPEDVYGAILSYLMKRPYHEVALGVQMLERLQESPPAWAVNPNPAPELALVEDAKG